ncbi:inositol monophosphatase family protein [Brachybacterium saurashtrense]|uniref:Inositol monophosphatase n=1 Tax=Brachybacterium saurashtrense TaxID=556288 RepID=A0A345YLP0_9MICO|nr:inositol monophosphatase [Brachybacterium saurashtrense]AXK44842.1 inositol monophosphatase [Brachybacterium saurashtrense]RRR20818.1 inositol monophosphatase [Brachybacterium saurashtrense]
MNTSAPRPTPDAPSHAAPAVPSPAELRDIALAAAHEAAEYLRGLDRDGMAREYKTSSHDIVTEHDRASEEIIVAALTRLLPRARIVGEEGGVRPAGQAAGEAGASAAEGAEVGQDTAPGAPVVSFYVDPIDGTSNFAAGLPLFCISIGVAVGDELVAGVIDAPILGQVFAAADGDATLNGRVLAPRPTRPAPDALVLSGFPGQRTGSQHPEYAARGARRLEDSVSAVRHLGSAALELAYVAAGWADATALTAINSWDVAAGFHILRRAGGSLRTWPGADGLERPDHLQPAYVACTGQERLEVLDALQQELQELRSATR